MENPQNKKPNKYVVLATYLVAVVCLLSGLFLPFFGGKDFGEPDGSDFFGTAECV